LFAINLSANKTTGAQCYIQFKKNKRQILDSILVLKILREEWEKADVDGSKLHQLQITMQNLAEIDKRVSI